MTVEFIKSLLTVIYLYDTLQDVLINRVPPLGFDKLPSLTFCTIMQSCPLPQACYTQYQNFKEAMVLGVEGHD